MNEVKRYSWHVDAGCMIEEADGAYVESEDYAALEAERDHLKACQENAQLHITGLVAERNAALMQRDKLAGLLRHASSVLGIHGWDALTHEIDTALSELTP